MDLKDERICGFVIFDILLLMCPASVCSVYRYGDLEQEAQELGVGKEMEVMCLLNKLYPFAIDDVATLPFVQVCTIAVIDSIK